MANTTTQRGNIIEVSTIATDWDWEDASGIPPNGIFLQSISFVAGSNNDVVVIKEGSDSGPIIAQLKSTTAGVMVDVLLDGLQCRPVIDFSACTLNAGHKVIFRMV